METRQFANGQTRFLRRNARCRLAYLVFHDPAVPNFDLAKFDFDCDTPKTYQAGVINDAASTDLGSFARTTAN